MIQAGPECHITATEMAVNRRKWLVFTSDKSFDALIHNFLRCSGGDDMGDRALSCGQSGNAWHRASLADRENRRRAAMRANSGSGESKSNQRDPTLRDRERARGKSGEAITGEKKAGTTANRKPARSQTGSP
jgi:hypothetical protein